MRPAYALLRTCTQQQIPGACEAALGQTAGGAFADSRRCAFADLGLGSGDGDSADRVQLCRADLVAEANLDLLRRGPPQPLHGVLGYQPAFPDNRDPVSDTLHLVQLVRGQEDGPPGGSGLTEQALELMPHQRIEPGRRLVEYQQLRPVHEGQDQAGLLPVALRQFADRAIGHYLEPVGQLPCQRVAGTAGAGESGDVLAAGQPGEQFEIARQVAGTAMNPGAADSGIKAKDPGRLLQGQQHPDGCRFARPVRTEEAEDLPRLDPQVQAGHRGDTAVPLGQPDRLNRRGHLPVLLDLQSSAIPRPGPQGCRGAGHKHEGCRRPARRDRRRRGEDTT
jgi:hypothetical protein